MSQIQKIFNDKQYLAELINYSFTQELHEDNYKPLNLDWIDAEASDYVSDVFRRLSPDDMPYLTTVLVERNPSIIMDGLGVEDFNDRQRYVIISVIPDTEFPFDFSYPLIHYMWNSSLNSWEIIRAMLAACRQSERVVIQKNPVPPILNCAEIKWISLYLGRKPYEGCFQLTQQADDTEDSNIEKYDVNLVKVREADPYPLLQRLIEAYDADCPEAEK